MFHSLNTGKYRIIKNGLNQFIIQEQYRNTRTGETWHDYSKHAVHKTYEKAKKHLDIILTTIESYNKQEKLLNTVEVLYET